MTLGGRYAWGSSCRTLEVRPCTPLACSMCTLARIKRSCLPTHGNTCLFCVPGVLSGGEDGGDHEDIARRVGAEEAAVMRELLRAHRMSLGSGW